METRKTRQILSAGCHFSVWLSSTLLAVAVPLAVMLGSDDPIVKTNAKEALNCHINLWIAYVVFGVLCIVLIGIPFIAAAGIYNLLMPLIAMVAVIGDSDKPYRYPFMLHIIDTRNDPLLPPPVASSDGANAQLEAELEQR